MAAGQMRRAHAIVWPVCLFCFIFVIGNAEPPWWVSGPPRGFVFCIKNAGLCKKRPVPCV